MTPQQLPLPKPEHSINPDDYTFRGYGISPKHDPAPQVARAVAAYRGLKPDTTVEVWSRAAVPVPENATLVIDRRVPVGVVLLGGER